MNTTDFLANLHEVGLNDLDKVGGKNASLGEMLQNLAQLGIRIPAAL
jgi:pyruvate,water dikinase